MEPGIKNSIITHWMILDNVDEKIFSKVLVEILKKEISSGFSRVVTWSVKSWLNDQIVAAVRQANTTFY